MPIISRIYEKEAEIMAVWQKTRDWSLEAYRQFEQRLGIQCDAFYLESQTYEPGIAIVRQHIGDIFVEDEGAVIFRGEPYGLHTRVFINQRGNPTYEAKDVGLFALKQRDYDFDLAMVETGNDQRDYWNVLQKVLELLYPPMVGKIGHLHHGLINLSTGKMSSRTGNILTAFSLVETVKERVKEYITANRDYSAAEVERIADVVAIGAIKYSFLKSTVGKDVSFDVESSIAFEGNSGPYLQYTYARCQSVVRKAETSPSQPESSKHLLNNDELSLLRWLDRFNTVTAQAAAQYAPHMICGYLFELAQRYSYFYTQNQILTDDAAATAFRLQLTKTVAETLKNGLDLLGIEVTETI